MRVNFSFKSGEPSSLTTAKAVSQFIPPERMRYPFDEVCADIVEALTDRNFQVPGIKVELKSNGSGEYWPWGVDKIEGDDFKLTFLGDVREIVIPGKQLRVYTDDSGPTFYLYVGDDWQRDRDGFMNGAKVNSKRYEEPRTYLRYNGEYRCEDVQSSASDSRWKPFLVHTNDNGREYDPVGDEPKYFRTADVMEEIRNYLQDVVLPAIESHPIAERKVDLFPGTPAIPFPSFIGPLYCLGNQDEVERTVMGQEDVDQLPLWKRYGPRGSLPRLLPLGNGDGKPVPEIAYDGFLWCGIGQVSDETNIDSVKISGHYPHSDEKYLFRVRPRSANDIYIADHGAYMRRRQEIIDSAPAADYFTDAEIANFKCARARTIVPIHEYRGDFEQPVVLIRRELSFDEVEVVNGPFNEDLLERVKRLKFNSEPIVRLITTAVKFANSLLQITLSVTRGINRFFEDDRHE